MPGYDRTGPNGQGPITGRGLGPCGAEDSSYRRGRPMGRGFGYGRRGEFPGGRGEFPGGRGEFPGGRGEFGRGFPGGRGFGRGFRGNYIPTQENIESLSERIRKIEEDLNK